MEIKCKNETFLEIMQTSKAIHERIRNEINHYNLNITEFSVLEVLYRHEKQTIQQIGSSILISSGSMTYVIDKLEQKGLLNRHACPGDRRAINVSLTEAGNVLMSNIMPKHYELIDDMFESLTKDEKETIVKLLRKVKI
jgi:MarR family transcriptional regulator, 2-MHQ and catechol-resistance regulon repressor